MARLSGRPFGGSNENYPMSNDQYDSMGMGMENYPMQMGNPSPAPMMGGEGNMSYDSYPMSRVGGKSFGGPNERPMYGMEYTGPAKYPDQGRMPETYPMMGEPEKPRMVEPGGQPSPVAPVPAQTSPSESYPQVGELPKPGMMGSEARAGIERQRLDDQRIAQNRADEAAVERKQRYLGSSPYAAM